MSSKRARPDDVIDLTLGDLKCSVTRYGATVLSFSIKERQVLFQSEKAVLDGSKAIRGGIPLVFPMFGPGDGTLPQHGFARTSMWKVEHETDSLVVLSLSFQDALSSDAWKYPFKLEYTIRLSLDDGGALITSMRIMNVGLVGEDAFEFQCLQHTYIEVPDISKVSVLGLEGASYINQLSKGAVEKLLREPLKINQEVDWIFTGNSPPGSPYDKVIVSLGEGNQGVLTRRSFHVASVQMPCDAVVWNPWIEKSKKMSDFGDEEYRRMICVEPGNVSRKDILKGGQDAVLTQVLSICSL